MYLEWWNQIFTYTLSSVKNHNCTLQSYTFFYGMTSALKQDKAKQFSLSHHYSKMLQYLKDLFQFLKAKTKKPELHLNLATGDNEEHLWTCQLI